MKKILIIFAIGISFLCGRMFAIYTAEPLVPEGQEICIAFGDEVHIYG